MLARFVARVWRWGRGIVLAVGAAALLGFAWLAAGLPLGFDAALDVTTAPAEADAIVCIGGGTMSRVLPTAEGWQRIHTSVQLYADGFAPVVVFTGRGNAKVSEAEIYAEAAEWLGLPRAVVRLDPLPASTAEHPGSLLKSLPGQITHDSRILLVTSTLHSRRVLMTFRRHGFTNVRVVSHHVARTRLPTDRRSETSALPEFEQDDKAYRDVLFRLAHRSSALLWALREWAAIGVYRWRGDV